MLQQDLSSEEMIQTIEKEQNSQETPQEASPEAQQTSEPEGPQYLDLGQFNSHHVKYTANGKEISEPLDMVLKRASQGYNYGQHMNELKAEQEAITGIKQKNEELQRWQQYDTFAKENPEWAKHVQDNWDSRHTHKDPNLDPDDPVTQRFASIEKSLENFSSQFGEKIGVLDDFINQNHVNKEATALDSEISGVTNQFKQIDFGTPDENGKTVETHVLEHMQRMQIPSFKAAFTDLYLDQILNTTTQQARQQQANAVQKQNKQGIIGSSPTPMQSGSTSNQNISSTSWNDLRDLAIKELNNQGG